MIFNSIDFAIFLPIVFLLYWFVFNKNTKLQNAFIVLVSYIFYGWWDWKFLILIAFTSFVSWGSGLLIGKNNEHREKQKIINILNIVVNILILCLFKYYNFFISSFADAFMGGDSGGLLLNIVLPVGISFYTFQALSYSIDVYRGKVVPTRDVVQFFAFVSFFPQLVAGPIERASNLLPQFAQKRSFDYAGAVEGCRQILWGMFKKVVIADSCASIVDNIFENYDSLPASVLLLGAFLFSFQIYGDFSGYSDIAIGVAKLFGFKLMRNFNVPYFSRDIAEFWRRWHISLTTWFRDYVYIPLGGSRVSKAKVIRNTFVIFILSGFWHGANWTFVAWGAYHALLFLPLILTGKNRKYTDCIASGKLFPSVREFLQMVVTFFFVLVGWIVFRADTISDACNYVINMFSFGNFLPMGGEAVGSQAYIALLFIFIMLVVEWLGRSKRYVFDMDCIRNKPVRIVFYYVVFIVVIIFCGKAQPFIYFQF
jgi:D-alanyl-lipoteichoic acid acyltransferase DltB (MBOAT superfamily)